MKIRRRDWMRSAAAAGLGTAATRTAAGSAASKIESAMLAPVLRSGLAREKVEIQSIELLRNGKSFIVRARSKAGVSGYADAHSSVMASAYPILVRKIAPYFAGKDARDLETLLHGVYLDSSNYKWQGLPFWVSVAVTEIAILDLLGKTTGKPLGELFAPVIRRQIPVYRASGNRGNTPEAEIEYLQKIVSETGAGAIKFRLGARMHHDAASTRRDETLIPLTRKVFGPGMAIYADANGSYDVPLAIRIGRIMEQHKFGFLEEPVPFDFYEETKQIADALTIPIAMGEEEMSLRGFRRIIETGTAQVIQPDLLYFGGMIRALKVARMAEAAGLDCTPHMSGGGLGFLYIAHFASIVKNCGAHQEYKGEDDILPVSSETSSLKSEKGKLTVPTGPGLGVTIDPDFISKAKTVSA